LNTAQDVSCLEILAHKPVAGKLSPDRIPCYHGLPGVRKHAQINRQENWLLDGRAVRIVMPLIYPFISGATQMVRSMEEGPMAIGSGEASMRRAHGTSAE